MMDGALIRMWVKFCIAFAFIIVAVGELRSQGFLIPDTTRRDVVFDFAGQNLYISTSTGLIKTFDLSTFAFGRSYNLGGSVWGIDIARDDSFILAAQNSIGAGQGVFERVNLLTGAITNINYARSFGEGGAWDVAIASNGLALVTTQYQGSGWTPLRQIDLSTNAITIRTDAPGSGFGEVRQNTQIHRSANGTRLLLMESNISSGPLFTYSAATNSFGPSFDTNAFLDIGSASGAVNRNGSLIGLRTYASPASLNTAPGFEFVHSFNGIDSGVAFDAVRGVFYGVNSETDEIIAYRTTTYAELFRLSIGEDIGFIPNLFATGTLVASADGKWLALETDSGIRLFQVAGSPIPTPTPSTTPTPTPSSTPASQLGNISTRAFVQTGDNVVIGGFIVQGTEPKRVIIRAIGPELTQYGVPNVLADPTLELHDSSGDLIASNDNWQHTIIGGIITSDQVLDIRRSGHVPRDARESAIIAELPAGNYTAIVRGVNETMGVALVEAYDLDPDSNSLLGNISTRSFVQTDDNVMIGGFIVQGTQPKRVILRAIGPELSQFGVPNPLADPTLELHDSMGALIASNDNWLHTIIGGIIASDQVHDIRNSGLAPGNRSESAIIATLPPGNYTAIVRGVNNTTGVGLVEVYDLD
jgi:hypothetical protein